MSDQTSTLLIKLLSTGDFQALTEGKEKSEALKLSVEGLKVAFEALGVGLSLGALMEGTKAMVEYGAQLEHLSAQAGISTDAFQNLSYAAIGAGLHAEDLSQAFSVLQRNMAQAADGATKQNHAIADLGLSTSEMLKMTGDQQIEAIARAYVNASDKTKAWADVVALLGRNSAHVKELLTEIGEHGLVENPLKISEEDIGRLEQTERFWAQLWMEVKGVAGTAVARPFDALMTAMGNQSTGQFMAGGTSGGFGVDFHGDGTGGGDLATPAELAQQRAAANAEEAARIQQLPQMIALHQSLAKSEADVAAATDTRAEAAARLRKESSDDLHLAFELAKNTTDEKSQLESVKLRIEAAQLEAKANKEDAAAKKENAKADFEFANASAQLGAKLASGTSHEQVAAVELAQRQQENQDRREAIGLAVIEHDINKSDAEKWEEKRAALADMVKNQEAYIARMADIAGDDRYSADARAKAGSAAESGGSALAGMKGQLSGMGPNPNSFAQNLSSELTKLQNQWHTLQQNMASGLTGVISKGFQSVASELTKVIEGAETFGQAIKNVAVDIGESLVQAIIDAGVQWVASEAMKLAFGTTAKGIDAGTSAAAAEATASAWGVPAALVSVASFGAADIVGMAALTAAVADGEIMGSIGFADGGYTGGVEGQTAGMVHGQEFVWSAPAVRAVGVGNLERAHQSALGGGGVSASGGGSGRASGNIIVAMSPGDVAKSQRTYVDSRVIRMSGKLPTARYAL